VSWRLGTHYDDTQHTSTHHIGTQYFFAISTSCAKHHLFWVSHIKPIILCIKLNAVPAQRSSWQLKCSNHINTMPRVKNKPIMLDIIVLRVMVPRHIITIKNAELLKCWVSQIITLCWVSLGYVLWCYDTQQIKECDTQYNFILSDADAEPPIWRTSQISWVSFSWVSWCCNT
jgi:hypothetical protein